MDPLRKRTFVFTPFSLLKKLFCDWPKHRWTVWVLRPVESEEGKTACTTLSFLAHARPDSLVQPSQPTGGVEELRTNGRDGGSN